MKGVMLDLKLTGNKSCSRTLYVARISRKAAVVNVCFTFYTNTLHIGSNYSAIDKYLITSPSVDKRNRGSQLGRT